MPRVSLELAHERRSLCHSLRAEGLSIRQICGRTGLQLRSVQNYLATSPDSSQVDAIAQVLLLKAAPEHKHRGSLELQPMVGGISRRTIEYRIAAAGLARKGVYRQSSRAPY